MSSCSDRIQDRWEHDANVPIYQSAEQFRKSTKVSAPELLKNPGKIYVYGKYLFINEQLEGVHIYDNSNPSAPENLAFLPITGNIDISIRNNYLYADSYIDLLVFDIKDISNIKLVKRYENIFPNVVPSGDIRLPIQPIDTTKGIVVGWEVKKVSDDIQTQSWITFRNNGGVMIELAASSFDKATVSLPSNTTGIGGSRARFTISNSYLYTLNSNELKSFNIDNPAAPKLTSTNYVWRTPESIFPYKGNLFIGTTTGMMIYGLGTPENPTFTADIGHFRSCDPVVVEDNYAYVTLRAGSGCGQALKSEFIIYDVSTITSPKQVNEVELQSPYGLGISNKRLFICDGDAGLKVYDVSAAKDVKLIKQFKEVHAQDVIPLESTLLMIGKDGLYQYDFSNIDEMKQVSKISIVQ